MMQLNVGHSVSDQPICDYYIYIGIVSMMQLNVGHSVSDQPIFLLNLWDPSDFDNILLHLSIKSLEGGGEWDHQYWII